MPLASALLVGVLKATGSIMASAMPLTLAAMAVFMAATISETMEFSEPVHCALGCQGSRPIGEAVEGGGEEGVGGDVANEREPIGRVRSEGGLENRIGSHPLAGQGARGDWRWRAYRSGPLLGTLQKVPQRPPPPGCGACADVKSPTAADLVRPLGCSWTSANTPCLAYRAMPLPQPRTPLVGSALGAGRSRAATFGWPELASPVRLAMACVLHRLIL